MKFVIISHAVHLKEDIKVYSYGPYVREMNLWLAHVEEAIVVAPLQKSPRDSIFTSYEHPNLEVKSIPAISLTSIPQILKTIVYLPSIFFTIFHSMYKADHIHLRCPGNIGLIGCLAQVFFPSKKKTAKYAGNWDLNAKQPLSYRFQKWLLSNTFWTKNMQVLVYGEWPNQSKNIKSFFTASYKASEISNIENKKIEAPFNFIFVGSLVEGKRPLYAIQLVEKLIKNGIFCSLKLYGDGVKRQELERYISENNLQENIILKGNQNAETVKKYLSRKRFFNTSVKI